MQSANKESISSNSKMDAMENKAMAEVIVLAENSEEKFDLTEIMQYRITDKCLSIFNINGSLRKGQKSKLIEKFSFMELNINEPSIALIDMGFMWRLSTPSAEDRLKPNGSFYTWGDYAEKIFFMICARHANASQVIFVNDPYDLPVNIKDCEHDRRAGTGMVGSVYMKRDIKIPSPQEFNRLFQNPQNKLRLQQFLMKEFRLHAQQKQMCSYIPYKTNVGT